MAWVDYQRAHNSLPHNWLLRCLKHKISPVLCRFLSRVMEEFEDIDGAFQERYHQHEAHADQVRYFKVIHYLLFSSVWLNPLSVELLRTGYGYWLSTGRGETAKRQLVRYLLYMDDMKLYGRNPGQKKRLLHMVRTFFDDIQMNFGLDKCASAHFVNGKLSGHNSEVEVGKTDTINCLEPGQVYKYLGVEKSNGIQHSTMRETLCREYVCRVKMGLRTELDSRNKILAINGFALLVLTYGFDAIQWRATVLQQLDRLTSTFGGRRCSYVPCSAGGEGARGLQRIKLTYQSCIVELHCCLCSSSDRLKRIVQECDARRSSHSIRHIAISVLHSCGGVSLGKTSRRACLEVGSSCVVSWSKRLRGMRNISARAAVLFVYSPGAENLFMVSITVY